MNEMTKKEKFKKFVSDHRETITKVTVYTTLIAGSIAIIAKTLSDAQEENQKRHDAIDEYNAWVDEENEWLEEKIAEGKDAYILHDLTYMFIPKDTEREYAEDRLNHLHEGMNLKLK